DPANAKGLRDKARELADQIVGLLEQVLFMPPDQIDPALTEIRQQMLHLEQASLQYVRAAGILTTKDQGGKGDCFFRVLVYKAPEHVKRITRMTDPLSDVDEAVRRLRLWAAGRQRIQFELQQAGYPYITGLGRTRGDEPLSLEE